MFQVPEARILKYSESNLEKLRALKREHEVNARTSKAAAAKRKQEQLEAVVNTLLSITRCLYTVKKKQK